MKMTVKRSTMVKPTEETPTDSVWLSSLDLLQPDTPFHARIVFFYRPDGAAANFFDSEMLVAALGRALVEFYPYAGLLRKDDDGRLEINCNGLGALFVEAECDGTLDGLGGFAPRADISLAPIVDYCNGISSFPLILLQLTRFACGGIGLGVSAEHHVADATDSFEFLLRWCDIARGGATAATAAVPPFMDRGILAPRIPPSVQFSHIEHQPPPSLKTPPRFPGEATTSFRTFSLSRDQINSLKQSCGHSNYTTYEVVTGHVWRCVSAARRLPEDQETKLQFPVDGRRRFRPPLPSGYFGNVNFYTAAVASCGELRSNPLTFAARKVHKAIARIDDEYMRSAVDYRELELPPSNGGAGVPLVEKKVKCPNLGITSWMRLPSQEMDFGWGKPIYAGLGRATPEGKGFLLADPDNEGGLLLAITLYQQHMEMFENLLYHTPT